MIRRRSRRDDRHSRSSQPNAAGATTRRDRQLTPRTTRRLCFESPLHPAGSQDQGETTVSARGRDCSHGPRTRRSVNRASDPPATRFRRSVTVSSQGCPAVNVTVAGRDRLHDGHTVQPTTLRRLRLGVTTCAGTAPTARPSTSSVARRASSPSARPTRGQKRRARCQYAVLIGLHRSTTKQGAQEREHVSPRLAPVNASFEPLVGARRCDAVTLRASRRRRAAGRGSTTTRPDSNSSIRGA